MKNILITLKRKEIIDISKLEIPEENSLTFWSSISKNEKEDLKESCKLFYEVFFKSNLNGFQISDLQKNELKTYYDYINDKTSPKLFFDYKIGKYKIKNGKHRLCMCKYLNINPIVEVSYSMIFENFHKQTLLERIKKENFTYIAIENTLIKERKINLDNKLQMKGYVNSKNNIRVTIIPYDKDFLNLIKQYKNNIYLSKDIIK